MKNIYDFEFEQLEEKCIELKIKKFRVKQIWNWLYINLVEDFDQMINVDQQTIQILKDNFELPKLEVKAVENTLSDIKEYDPELYKNLKDKKIDDIDKINTVVVGKVFEKAPEKKVKPGFEDVLEENAYDKYFKID